jgi:PAS domain S-box-containing protein
MSRDPSAFYTTALERMLEQPWAGVCFVDRSGVVRYANRAMLSMMGWTEDYQGQKCDEVLDPFCKELPFCPAHGMYEGSEPYDSMVSLTVPPGEYRYMRLRMDPVLDDEGTQIGVRMLALDFTEEQQKEFRLKQREVELDEIVSVTSHDMRSPLLNMKYFLQEMEREVLTLSDILSKNGEESEESRSIKNFMRLSFMVGQVGQYTDNLFKLIDGLTRFSRLATSELDVSRIDISSLTGSIIRQYPDVRLDYLIHETPPITADKLIIYETLRELIDNAIKFSNPEIPLSIEISGKKIEGHVEIIVEDNGQGMELDQLSLVTGLFYQTNPSETEGYGLGLAIARKGVEKHGGMLWIDSEPGEGTRVGFSLPCRGEHPSIHEEEQS